MLNRSLFEDMVDVHWVVRNPERAVQRLNEHRRYSQALRLDVARVFPEYFGDSLPELRPPMEDDERGRLAGIFGKHGERSWTGLSLHARFKDIESCWPDETARRQARFFHSWVHRTNNETLHPSSYSLGTLGGPTLINESLQYRLSSTEQLMGPALFCAFWTYVQTVTMVFATFELDVQEEFAAKVVEPGLAALTASQT